MSGGFFLVCAVVLCTVMAGATDAPLEQGRINQLSVCLSVCTFIWKNKELSLKGTLRPYLKSTMMTAVNQTFKTLTPDKNS